MLTHAVILLCGIAFGAGVTWVMRPVAVESASKAVTDAKDAWQGGSARPASALRKTAGPPLRSEQADTLVLDTAEQIQVALQRAAGLNSEQEKLTHYRNIFKTWAEKDPEGALTFAKQHFQPGLIQSEVIGLALNTWGTQDPRAAWLWADENLDGTLRDRSQNDVLIGWTRKSPAVAAEWLTSTGVTSQALHAAVARTWAERDPAAALQWAGKITSQKLRHTTESLVANMWASDQPARAAQLIRARPDLAAAIAYGGGQIEPKIIGDAIKALPASPEKTAAASALISTWSAQNPDAALGWAMDIKDPASRRQAITQYGTTVGATAPGKALGELAKLPAAETSDAIIGAFNSWAATDPVGLHQYVNSNSKPSAGMDQARLSLADVYSDTDVAASMQLSLGLSSPIGREDALAHYFRHWRKVDDASAQDWLIQNWTTLAPSAQKRLIQEQNRVVVPR